MSLDISSKNYIFFGGCAIGLGFFIIQKKQRSHYKKTLLAIHEQLVMFEDGYLREALEQIPESWRFLDIDIPAEPKKIRVNFYLDEPIYRLFSREGVNWQKRIRAILRSFVALRVKKMLIRDRPDALELVGHFLGKDARSAIWAVHRMRYLAKKNEDEKLGRAIENIAQAVGGYQILCEEILQARAKRMIADDQKAEWVEFDEEEIEALKAEILDRVSRISQAEESSNFTKKRADNK